jgi:chemotaxis protein MotB
MAHKRKKHVDHGEEHPDERWLITYADMITLLMAFFIMLFAMSQIDLEKFKKFQGGVSKAFDSPAKAVSSGEGLLAGSKQPDSGIDKSAAAGVTVNQRAVARAKARERKDLLEAKAKIEKGLAAKGLASRVHFELNERGLIVSIISDKVLFEPGSAELRTTGADVLDVVARMIAGMPNSIAVEGHTDNHPISSSQYPSNWELSTGRASTVVRYLSGRYGIKSSRLSAAGYADQHPAATNSTEQGRQRNRRVEIVLVSTVSERTS